MDYPEFREKYHITLNEQQETAVQTIEGPCLLLAVPGSGKTTVLVNRLAYMIYGKDIPPENILVLTYTVAAAKDMSSRFTRLFGNELEDRLEFRTINGICAKVILYYSHLIGRASYDLESSEKDRNRRISMASARKGCSSAISSGSCSGEAGYASGSSRRRLNWATGSYPQRSLRSSIRHHTGKQSAGENSLLL